VFPLIVIDILFRSKITIIIIILGVNTGKTKYMEIGRRPGVMVNDQTAVGRNSYEKVKSFKYLGSLLTNENSIHEEIKCRLKAGNSSYCSIHNFYLLDSSPRI
jgi:hypothetical protein